MEVKDKIIIYKCDVLGCRERSWLGNEQDWKMCEIVFGVHPSIIGQRTGPVAVIQEKFHFCRKHLDFKEELFRFITYGFPDTPPSLIEDAVSTCASLQEGLGCWITIHDCFSCMPIQNFQLPYWKFAVIYEKFSSLVSLKRESSEDEEEKIRILKEMTGTVNLSLR